MKIALTLGMMLSVSAFAAQSPKDVFGIDSPVPALLQEKILAAVQAECPVVASNLVEVSSKRTAGETERGSTDYVYSTEFSASYYFDGYHPITQSVLVKSLENANGASYEVLEVHCNP